MALRDVDPPTHGVTAIAIFRSVAERSKYRAITSGVRWAVSTEE
jgi:hypothetical protein